MTWKRQEANEVVVRLSGMIWKLRNRFSFLSPIRWPKAVLCFRRGVGKKATAAFDAEHRQRNKHRDSRAKRLHSTTLLRRC